MADSYEIAYLYGRICGAFSTMNLGAKGAAIARDSSLSDIWKLYFDQEIPDKPEAWILTTLEQKVIRRSVDKFLALAQPVLESDTFTKALSAKYEIDAVKSMLFGLADSRPRPDTILYVSPMTEKALAAWPRMKEMFAGTAYDWIDREALVDIGASENRLDREYYGRLWSAAATLPRRMLGNIPALILQDIRYQNLVWALRVRRYYGYTAEKTLPMLSVIDGEDTTSLALGTFDLDIDRLDSWEAWTGKKLLSSQTGTRLDIPTLELRVQKELFALVRRSLHMYPFGYTPLYCYFKMLEAEASLVLGILEGIRLKAPAEEKIDLAWALLGESV